MTAVITLGKAPTFTETVMRDARITARKWTATEIADYRHRHRAWRRWGWLYEDWGVLGRLPSAIATRCGVPRYQPHPSTTLIENVYIDGGGFGTAFEVQA